MKVLPGIFIVLTNEKFLLKTYFLKKSLGKKAFYYISMDGYMW